MICELRFHKLALDEWNKLGTSLREQFKKKLFERLKNPRVPSATLSGMPDCYKIKLQRAGYRLIYRVEDETVFVTVLAVCKRYRFKAYNAAQNRI